MRNQTSLTMLLGQAAGDINKRMESFLDFDAAKSDGRFQMEMAAGELGLREHEGREAYDAGFPDLKQDLLVWIAKKARAELDSAVAKVEGVEADYAMRIGEVRGTYRSMVNMLEAHQQKSLTRLGHDSDWVVMITASHEAMMAAAQKFHDDMLGAIRAKFRLTLEHCFTSHLVSAQTAAKLAALYDAS